MQASHQNRKQVMQAFPNNTEHTAMKSLKEGDCEYAQQEANPQADLMKKPLFPQNYLYISALSGTTELPACDQNHSR